MTNSKSQIPNNDQLPNEIKALVAKVIKIPQEKIDLNANLFTDLGVDSLLGVEILAALDKKYGLDIPENKLKDIKSLNDIIGLVQGIVKR